MQLHLTVRSFLSAIRPCLTTILAAVLLLADVTATPTQAQTQNPPAKTFLPLVQNAFCATCPRPLADLAWRWADYGSAAGSAGIAIADLDGDGKNEVLTANQEAIVALGQRAGRFEEIWALPMGVAWGIAPLAPGHRPAVWVMESLGKVEIYAPFGYSPFRTIQLPRIQGAQFSHAVLTDVIGDSEPEMVVYTHSQDLVAYSLCSAQPVWRYHLDNGGSTWVSIGVAQVDDDPAREIILSTGLVVDPASNTVEWRYPEGFSGFRTADIDNDGRDEIVASYYPLGIKAFDVETHTTKWTLPNPSADAFELADVGGNATPEFLVSRWNGLQAYDAATLELLWQLAVGASANRIAVGDADSDGLPDIVWGAGRGGGGSLRLMPLNQPDKTVILRSPTGEFPTAALQLDADTPLELLVFPYASGGYFVLDSATGAEQPEIVLPVMQPQAHLGTPMLSANVDADPLQELFLDVGSDLLLLDHDGALLASQDVGGWRVPRWVGDIDEDGELELIASAIDTYYVYQIDTLALEYSKKLREPMHGLAVADVDDDGAQEIVALYQAKDLEVYDGKTHALEWQMPLAYGDATALAIGNADGVGGLEFVTLENWRLMFYDAATHTLIKQGPKLSYVYDITYGNRQLAFVHLTGTPYPQLLAISPSQTVIFEHPLDDQPA